MIDFLAGLLHLGGLPGEVAEVITRLQSAVYAVMDRIIGFLAARARALLARMGIGETPPEGGREGDSELGTTVRFTADRDSHRVWFNVAGEDSTLMVASVPEPIETKIAEWRGKVSTLPEDRQPGASSKLDALAAVADDANAEGDRLAREFLEANRDPNDTTEPPNDNALESRERAIAGMLRELFEIFGERASDASYLADMTANLPIHGRAYAETVAGQWEPTITRAKIAPDGTTRIWDLSVVSPDGALALLRRDLTRRELLPWFLIGSQSNPRSASSGTFRNHAFQTDSPDPPHTVRTEFVTTLGSDTATRMIRTANRTITAEDNSDLLRQLQGIAFTMSGGRWGAFLNLPVDTVNPLIKTAIQQATGIISFLRAMVSPGTFNGVTWARFLAVWNASPETKNHVKGLFRRVQPRSHEWITTGFIPQVIETAIDSANAGNIRDGFRWAVAHNTLRSPTRWVLHRPSVLPRRPERGEQTHLGPAVTVGLSGHVGAFRRREGAELVTTGTIGTEDFHDWLREEFNAQKSLGPLGYIRHLQSQLSSRVWDGGTDMIPVHLLNQPVGMLYRVSEGVDVELTIGQLALRQRLNWLRIQRNFNDAHIETERETGA